MKQSFELLPNPQLARRQTLGKVFAGLCGIAAVSSVLILIVLLGDIVLKGWGVLSPDFFRNFNSQTRPETAGIRAGIAGSVWLMALTTLIATPLGIAAAIYFEEYAPKNKFNNFLEINIANLAGVPSIIYGILGLTIFARVFGFGQTIISGALVLSLLVLPVIIIASREAIRTVPPSQREASYALGATRWQTTWRVVLPSALPGILTGLILALSRAIGETAPIITIGAFAFVSFVPQGPNDQFTALPIMIFNWASMPQEIVQRNAAGAIIVLLAVLISLNSVAIFLRYFAGRNKKA